MRSKLEHVVDFYIKNKEDKIPKEKSDEENQYFIDALKRTVIDDIKKDIQDEIRSQSQMEAEELKQDALKRADEEIERKKQAFEKELRNRKIEEIKSLIYSGIIVAFIAGLLVNEISDIINMIKHVFSPYELAVSLFLIFALGYLLVKLTLVEFIKNSLKLIEEE